MGMEMEGEKNCSAVHFAKGHCIMVAESHVIFGRSGGTLCSTTPVLLFLSFISPFTSNDFVSYWGGAFPSPFPRRLKRVCTGGGSYDGI